MEVRTYRQPVLTAERDTLIAPAIAIAGLLSLAFLIWVAVETNNTAMVILFTTTLLCLSMWAVSVLLPRFPTRRGLLRVAPIPNGLRIVGSPWPARAEALAVVPASLGLVAGLFNLRQGVDGVAAVLLLALLAIGTATSTAKFLRGDRGTHEIDLDHEVITLAQDGAPLAFHWTNVTGVDLEGKGGRIVLYIDHEGVPAGGLHVSTQEFRSDPAVLARLIRTFVNEPRRRLELADGRALEAIAAGRIDGRSR